MAVAAAVAIVVAVAAEVAAVVAVAAEVGAAVVVRPGVAVACINGAALTWPADTPTRAIASSPISANERNDPS